MLDLINLARGNADINQIVSAFGLSSRQVVLDKINGNIINLGEALNTIYSRIKSKGH